jgi:hypothetical protein
MLTMMKQMLMHKSTEGVMRKTMDRMFGVAVLLGVLLFVGNLIGAENYSDKTMYNSSRIVTPLVGPPPDQSGIYDETNGLTLSADYVPSDSSNGPIRALLCTGGSGNIKLQYANGCSLVVAVTVTAGDHEVILRGQLIRRIYATGTTFDGAIHPLF